MAENTSPSDGGHLIRIEPDDRVVVLARTMQAQDPDSEPAWKEGVARWTRFGPTCLGQALYRHRSVFKGVSAAPVWSHLELSYFRDFVPVEVLRDLVDARPPPGAHLLRAELLLTTPSSFVMPRAWPGSAERPERQTSLEYIDVDPRHLRAYREIMRDYIGPAAAKLVEMDRIGTFRAMETAAVLYRDPSMTVDWNQLHLCEVDVDGFRGFGQEFDDALRGLAPDGDFTGVFAGLERMRSIPRWTFNEPVVEADAAVAVARSGSAPPLLHESME